MTNDADVCNDLKGWIDKAEKIGRSNLPSITEDGLNIIIQIVKDYEAGEPMDNFSHWMHLWSKIL